MSTLVGLDRNRIGARNSRIRTETIQIGTRFERGWARTRTAVEVRTRIGPERVRRGLCHVIFRRRRIDPRAFLFSVTPYRRRGWDGQRGIGVIIRTRTFLTTFRTSLCARFSRGGPRFGG